MTHKVWTNEKIAELTQLIEKDYSTRSIAMCFGLTYKRMRDVVWLHTKGVRRIRYEYRKRILLQSIENLRLFYKGDYTNLTDCGAGLCYNLLHKIESKLYIDSRYIIRLWSEYNGQINYPILSGLKGYYLISDGLGKHNIAADPKHSGYACASRRLAGFIANYLEEHYV